MPYTITTKDGIRIQNIPDDIAPDAQVLKDRVIAERTKRTVSETVPEDSVPPEGFEAFIDVDEQGIPTRRLRPIEPEPTTREQIIGAGETALALGTGATGGAVGQIGGTLKGLAEQILSGSFGTQEAGRLVEQAAQEGASALTYEPRTEIGREYLQETAEVLAPLEALGPLGAELETAARGVRVAPQRVSPGTRAAEAVATAERAGITPMTSDIFQPKTFVGKLGQAIGERIPFVGTGGTRSAQQVERVGAIKSFLNDFGVVGADSTLNDVMSSLTTKRQDKINRFANIKKDVFAKMPTQEVGVNRTIGAIDSEIARLTEMRTEGVKPLISVLEDYKNAFQNQNITNIEALRKQLGDQLDSPDLVSVTTESGKASKNIYGALNEDIGDFVKQNGEPKDFNKWKIANKELSNTFSDVQNSTLKSVLRKGDATPEDVKRLLFSQKPSDIKILYKNLDKQGKANARTAILHEVINKSGGPDDFSVQRFESNLKKMQKSTGVFFEGDNRTALNGLKKALELTKRAQEASFKPTTGAEVTAFATPTAISYLAGTDPITGLALTGGVGLMTKLYESKPIRNTLIQIAKAPKGKEMPLIAGLNAIIQSQKEKEDE